MENPGNKDKFLMAGKIVIAGSCLAALSMKVAKFPVLGETVAADLFISETGGKGTNQALAAARLGSKVFLIGCVGEDIYSKGILQTYKEFGVNTDGIRKDSSAHSGVAFVIINRDGNNMITVAPGANFKLTRQDFDNNEHLIKKCDIIGFGLALNIDFVEHGIKKAHSMGIKTLLDPAPVRSIDESVYCHLDFIKPNETEAAFLTGIEVVDENSAFKAADWFLDKGVKNAVITLGEKGVVILNHEIKKHIASPKVNVQDATAAGDVFSGAMMHCIADGMELIEAVRFGVYASSMSVQTLGAINSMPTKQEVINFRNSFN